MPKFKFQENEYALVEKPLFAEFAWIEDQSGVSMEDMKGTRKTVALVLLSLRRANVLLTWDDVMNMSTDAFEWVEEEENPTEGEESAEPSPN